MMKVKLCLQFLKKDDKNVQRTQYSMYIIGNTVATGTAFSCITIYYFHKHVLPIIIYSKI